MLTVTNTDEYIGSIEFYLEVARIGAIIAVSIGLVMGIMLMMSGAIFDGLVVGGGIALLSCYVYKLYEVRARSQIIEARVNEAQADSVEGWRQLRTDLDSTLAEQQQIAAEQARIRRGIQDYHQEMDELQVLYEQLQQFIDTELPNIVVPENPIDECLKHLSDDVLRPIRCPILLQVMQDPVIADDNNTYERFALQSWYDRGHHNCPLNPAASLSDPRTLPVNQAVKDAIDELVREHTHQASPH